MKNMSSNLKITAILVFSLIMVRCQTEKKEVPSVSETIVAPSDALFQSLPAEATGIDFSNNIKEDFQNNIITNSYMYNGGGVAIADFNNDGLDDLFFTATQENCRLYLNEGNLKFKDITQSAGISNAAGYKTGVTIVDINQDGYKDIYVTRTGMNEGGPERANLLYVNQGNLTFQEMASQYLIADPSASNHANFFDYDLDGDLDLYVLNYPIAFQDVNRMTLKEENGKRVISNQPKTKYDTDRLYRNEGNGTFTDVTQQAGIVNRGWGLSVTVSDLNDDGYPDIFVGNDYIVPDFLYINQKNGTFKNENDKYFGHTSNHTMGVDIADINNDQRVDLIALDMLAEDNFRQKNLMTTMLVDRYNSMVKYGYTHQQMRNVLQLNNGNGSFSEIGVLSGVSNTDWSWCSLFADFDLDGYKDLYITNGYRRDVSELDYVNYVSDSINNAGGITTSAFKTFDDFLKLVPAQKLQNYMYRNAGNLQFENKSTDWGFVQKTWSNGAAYGDLDNDGDLEIVVNNIDENALFYKNMAVERGTGNWLKVNIISEKPNLDGNGAKARLTFSDGTAQYLEMNPTRGFLSSVQEVFHFGFNKKTPTKLEIEFPNKKLFVLENPPINKLINADVKRAVNGSISKSESNNQFFQKTNIEGIDYKHVENDFIDFHREGLIPHKLSNLGPKVAVADVNNDRKEDIFVGGAANTSGALFLQNDGGRFSKSTQNPWSADAASEDLEPLFFDADKDGDMDLYVVSGGNAHNDGFNLYQDRLYLNDGKGNFSKTILPTIGTSGSCVAAHDYDSDGDMDLIVGGRVKSGSYPMSPNSFVLQNEGGKFTDVTTQIAPELQQIGMITDLVWANIDGQAGDELIVTGEWMPVSIFKMENGKLTNKTADFGLKNSNGWWHCATAADIDKDGDLDLIVGNMGSNIRLKPTSDYPIKMFAKDFDNNSQIDPVMAWAEKGKYYPIPNRDKIIKQLPHLRKKFQRYTAYSKATIEEVFSKEELNDALKLEAKTFATSIFINNGNGSFSQKELPIEAQIAPTNEIAVEDINKDGHKDLILIGNNHGIQVESGRIDAGKGTVLLGNGKGDFTALDSSDSGLWADGDTRDIDPILINGKKHFIITVNDAPMTIFSLK